jgi:predicted nucleic acid-binding protein
VRRTYVDASVLIAAARGTEEVSTVAMAVLSDPNREFVASAFLRLETTAPSTYHNFPDQAAFYEAYFAGVTIWTEISDELVAAACRECASTGIRSLDAIHLAAAAAVGADEFVTAERRSGPMDRTALVKVVSIRP